MFPYLSEIKSQKKQIVEFRGYNHNSSIAESEFYDTYNLSSSYYPAISPRKPRGTVQEIENAIGENNPHGLFAKNKLAWVSKGEFFYDNVIRGAVTDTDKQFVSMGAYILIFPDKKYFNTETEVFGSLENSYLQIGDVTFAPSKLDGSVADSVTSLYVKISSSGIHMGFKQYDGVTISGCSNALINGPKVIQTIGTNFIVVSAKSINSFTQSNGFRVDRTVPDMEYLTENDNRVWGCSSSKHELYSCKLGDPFNWNCYEGISTDSYAVTIGSDGDFTGAFTYGGYVLFFKEDCIHKIHGNKPSNFQVFENSVRGVAKGSHKSLCVVNETLYYMSQNGIVAYEGSLPVSISHALGDIKYSNAVAGRLNDKYYISMQSGTKWYMFAYDTKLNMWYKEDNTHVLDFAYLDGKLYYIDSDSFLRTVEGADEERVKWYAEFSDFEEKSFNKKYVSKVQLRVDLEEESFLDVDIMYDGLWEKIGTISSKMKRSHNMVVPIRRCESYKLRLSGVGQCKVYSMAKTITEGSDS